MAKPKWQMEDEDGEDAPAGGEQTPAFDEETGEVFFTPGEPPMTSTPLTSRQLTDLSLLYDKALDEEEAADRIASEATKKRQRLEQRMWDEIGEAGHDSFKRTEDGISFIRKETLYAKVVDRDAFIEWIEDNQKHDDLLKMDFQKKRLNEMVNKAVPANKALPPGLDFSATRYITRAKGRKKSYVPDTKVEGSHGEVDEI